ncbi:hypothetical protein, partial [Vibrio brasiliensis]
MTARNDHSIRNVGSIALTHTFCQWTAGERLQLSSYQCSKRYRGRCRNLIAVMRWSGALWVTPNAH